MSTGNTVSKSNSQATNPKRSKGLTVKSTVKAGIASWNHNQTAAPKKGLKVKASIKAGAVSWNHNQTLARGAR